MPEVLDSVTPMRGTVRRMNVVLHGTKESGGVVAVLLVDATWSTVRSAAESFEAVMSDPIMWRTAEVAACTLNDALIEAGLGDTYLVPA